MLGKFYSSFDPRRQRAQIISEDMDLADSDSLPPQLKELILYQLSKEEGRSSQFQGEGESVVVRRDENGYILPDKAQNNAFDFTAAQNFFHGLQEEGIQRGT